MKEHRSTLANVTVHCTSRVIFLEPILENITYICAVCDVKLTNLMKLIMLMNPTHDSLFAKEDVDHSDVFLPGIVFVALDLNNTAKIVIITKT